MMTDPELVAANAELSRACEAHAAKAEQWHRRAIEQERELAAARALLEGQARLIEERKVEQERIRADLHDAVQARAAAEAERDEAVRAVEDAVAEVIRLCAREEHLTIQLTQARAANARLQSQLEPARLRAWALYEGQTRGADE